MRCSSRNTTRPVHPSTFRYPYDPQVTTLPHSTPPSSVLCHNFYLLSQFLPCTYGYLWIPLGTSLYLSVPLYLCVPLGTLCTSWCSWVPLGTSCCLSHLLVPLGTSRYVSVPHCASQYLSVPLGTSWNLSVPLGTSRYL